MSVMDIHPFFFVAAWFLAPILMIMAVILYRGRHDPRCRFCKYSFLAHVPSQCPECGKAIFPYMVRKRPSLPYRTRMCVIVGASLMLALLPAAIIFGIVHQNVRAPRLARSFALPFSYEETIGGPGGFRWMIETDGRATYTTSIILEGPQNDEGHEPQRSDTSRSGRLGEMKRWMRAEGIDVWLDARAAEWSAPAASFDAVYERMRANFTAARAPKSNRSRVVMMPPAATEQIQAKRTGKLSVPGPNAIDTPTALGILAGLAAGLVIAGVVIWRCRAYLHADVPEAFLHPASAALPRR